MKTYILWVVALLLTIPMAGQTMAAPFDVYPASYTTLQKRTPAPIVSAHRGGRFIAGFPENALETFQYVRSVAPVLIECDVNMSSDSVLLLMHDNTLDRTTNGRGKVQETPWSEIKSLYLKDDYGTLTRYHPPALSDVLDWGFNRTAYTLDVKRGVPIEKVVEAIRKRGAINSASVITYNYEDALRAYLEDPRVKISVNIRNEGEFMRYVNGPFNLKNLMAFTGLTARPPAFYKMLKDAGLKVIVGTIGNLDNSAVAKGNQVYYQLYERGADILATDRPLEVFEAFQKQYSLEEVNQLNFKN